jgi:hypothetical protein
MSKAAELAAGQSFINPCAFLVTLAAQQNNLAINTNHTIVFGTEIFDHGGNFASNTFTAPVTGTYQFNVSLYLKQLDTATGYYQVDIATSNRSYENIVDPTGQGADVDFMTVAISALADMEVNDTAFVRLGIPNSGAAQLDVATPSYFSGFRVS